MSAARASRSPGSTLLFSFPVPALDFLYPTPSSATAAAASPANATFAVGPAPGEYVSAYCLAKRLGLSSAGSSSSAPSGWTVTVGSLRTRYLPPFFTLQVAEVAVAVAHFASFFAFPAASGAAARGAAAAGGGGGPPPAAGPGPGPGRPLRRALRRRGGGRGAPDRGPPQPQPPRGDGGWRSRAPRPDDRPRRGRRGGGGGRPCGAAAGRRAGRRPRPGAGGGTASSSAAASRRACSGEVLSALPPPSDLEDRATPPSLGPPGRAIEGGGTGGPRGPSVRFPRPLFPPPRCRDVVGCDSLS